MPKKNNIEHTLDVAEEQNKMRLDKFIAAFMPEISRNRVQALIEQGNISISDKKITDRSHKVRSGDEISILIPPAEESKMQEADIPLKIVYEDDDLLVIDKQPGLTVHPGAGNHQDTMANALLKHCGKSLSGIGGVMRPGIVHRLDKDTSGLMVVAKNDKAHQDLAEQLKNRSLKRVYHAFVWGVPTPLAGKISANIGRSKRDRKKMTTLRSGGREAVTNYKLLKTYGKNAVSLVECRLETGRTHQIRVHMTFKGHSLIGDKTYGGKGRVNLAGVLKEVKEFIEKFPRQALHSTTIAFTHPISGKLLQFESNFSSGFPEDIYELSNYLGNLQKK